MNTLRCACAAFVLTLALSSGVLAGNIPFDKDGGGGQPAPTQTEPAPETEETDEGLIGAALELMASVLALF